MENFYASLAARTGGNIYLGVVGPMRTGKSTLIKRMMELMVIPNISDPALVARARDELPQSGSGKTIMTSEPKFIPEEAVEICPDGSTRMKIRLIDSVGYMVESAAGVQDENGPRMVSAPWADHPIPLTDAAEIGTKKIMDDHASIGILVTTDGTITDIPRSDYIPAEAKSIKDLILTGKPFITIINSAQPEGPAAAELQKQLKSMYHIDAAIANCQNISSEGLSALFQDLLYAFPLGELRVHLPRWVCALDEDDPIRTSIYKGLLTHVEAIQYLGQAEQELSCLTDLEEVKQIHIEQMDLSTGAVACRVVLPDLLYYKTLSKKTGTEIKNDGDLIKKLSELALIKEHYDHIAEALEAVRSNGYGVVKPTTDEMNLEKPQVIKKGNSYGVKLKAGASSIHMIRVDIDTEITPMVGDEKQSQDLISHLTQEDPEQLWESNIFGKSVHEMIQEGLNAKLTQTPSQVQEKFRESLSKIVNDGAAGLICIIL